MFFIWPYCGIQDSEHNMINQTFSTAMVIQSDWLNFLQAPFEQQKLKNFYA